MTSEESCVVPPETSIEVAFAPGYEQFVLRIEKDSLLNKLAALIGATPSRKLVFERTTRVNGSGIANVRRLLTFFAGELDSASNVLSPALVELEHALIVSFLCNNPHNYSAFLESGTRAVASCRFAEQKNISKLIGTNQLRSRTLRARRRRARAAYFVNSKGTAVNHQWRSSKTSDCGTPGTCLRGRT